MPRATRRPAAVLLAVLAAVLTGMLVACGGEPTDTGQAGDTGAMAGMNTGDPDAVAAAQVPGAELTDGRFQLLDTAPQGYQDTAGTATMARYPGGTTVTIRLTGLQPNTEFIAHVHQGQCSDNGGVHYKFDPAGSDQPPNEIHLAFTSGSDGTGFMTAENDRTAGPDARSVVVHPREFMDNRIACASLS